MTIDELRSFLQESTWIFAKSMHATRLGFRANTRLPGGPLRSSATVLM
jgi:hypothetical protein